MAATVNDVYEEFCQDVLEDSGLVLGVLTQAAFIDLFNLTLCDFLTQTALVKRIYTQTIFSGVFQYTVPDDIMRVDIAFLAGRYLPYASIPELNATMRNWRRDQGIPSRWYSDGLPPKTIGLALTPNYNGSYIIGANEPDPPHAQYDDFSATVADPSTPTPVLQNPAQHRGLTIVGPRKPAAVTALGDPIPLLADDWALGYLAFGIGERVFSGDNELKDLQAALFCHTQYQDGISLARSITGEAEETQQ